VLIVAAAPVDAAVEDEWVPLSVVLGVAAGVVFDMVSSALDEAADDREAATEDMGGETLLKDMMSVRRRRL
jgi:hypothetical protein